MSRHAQVTALSTRGANSSAARRFKDSLCQLHRACKCHVQGHFHHVPAHGATPRPAKTYHSVTLHAFRKPRNGKGYSTLLEENPGLHRRPTCIERAGKISPTSSTSPRHPSRTRGPGRHGNRSRRLPPWLRPFVCPRPQSRLENPVDLRCWGPDKAAEQAAQRVSAAVHYVHCRKRMT